MKKLVFIVVFFVPGFLMADNDKGVLSSFFQKYGDNQEFTYVNLTPKLFEMFATMDSEEDEGMINLIKSFTSVQLLSADSTGKSNAYYKEVQNLIDGNMFDELAVIRDGDENVKILVKEANSKISELLVVVSGSHNFVLVDMVGNIDLKDLKKLSKIKMNGMKYLEKADDKN